MSDPSTMAPAPQQHPHKTTTKGFSRVFARIFGSTDDAAGASQRRNPDIIVGEEEEANDPVQEIKPPPRASSSGATASSSSDRGRTDPVADEEHDAAGDPRLRQPNSAAATDSDAASHQEVASNSNLHSDHHHDPAVIKNAPTAAPTSTTTVEMEVEQPEEEPQQQQSTEPSNENRMDDDSADDATHSMGQTHATLLETTTSTATMISKNDGIPNNDNETIEREHDEVTSIPNSTHPEEEDEDEEQEIHDLAQVLVELHEQQTASRSSLPSAVPRHHHRHRDGRTRIRRSKRRRTSEASYFSEAHHRQRHSENPSVILNLIQQDEVADATLHKRIKTAIANSLNDDNNSEPTLPAMAVHPEATVAEPATTGMDVPAVRVSPHEQEQQIIRAAALVSRALIQGMWPSPYRRWPTPAGDPNNNYPAHRAHMSMVGVSLEKFARDIIVPALVWSENNNDNNNNSSNSPTREASTETTLEDPESVVHSPTPIATANDLRYPPLRRAFWGTLLLCRELLCQNAATIFGPQSPSSPTNNNDSDEETFFATQVLATAIVLTGLASEPKDNDEDENEKSNYAKLYPDAVASSTTVDQLKKDFLELVERYDRGDAEFADGLAPLLSPPPMPRKLAGEHERVAWQMGCNWHRERHPLRLSPSPRLADPTAVHVSILQFQGTLPPVTNGGGP